MLLHQLPVCACTAIPQGDHCLLLSVPRLLRLLRTGWESWAHPCGYSQEDHIYMYQGLEWTVGTDSAPCVLATWQYTKVPGKDSRWGCDPWVFENFCLRDLQLYGVYLDFRLMTSLSSVDRVCTGGRMGQGEVGGLILQ